jgi:tetratricopeptide (TPR) repeat protein
VRSPAPVWILLFLLTASFSLATLLQPYAPSGNQQGDSGGVLTVLLGDSRRLFADQFFEKADVYFHSGYYPSIFDERHVPKDSEHLTSKEGSAAAEAHEQKMNFLGPPKDWIERFGRHFLITEHTHLEGGNEREILPWLRVAAELDPHRIDTYTVAAFWLRDSLGKVNEAEQFLREGLRNNASSYELWFELGLLYHESRHDEGRARNAWELALRYWREQEPKKAEPDRVGFEKIVIHLARLEEGSGNLDRAVEYLKMALETSPNPGVLRQQIAELERKSRGAPATIPPAGPNAR